MEASEKRHTLFDQKRTQSSRRKKSIEVIGEERSVYLH